MPTFTVDALNTIEGVLAKGIFYGENKYIHKSESGHSRYYTSYSKKKNPFRYLVSKLSFIFAYLKGILWADVVHIVWDNPLLSNIDLWLAKALGKKRMVEWVGSDIRIPEIALRMSDYFHLAYNHPDYEYKGLESKERSIKVQTKFQRYGFTPLTYSELDLYLDKNLFPLRFFSNQRLPVLSVQAHLPSAENKRPLIIHSPTAPIFKGSNHILTAIEHLKKKYNFDFRLLTNMKREEVLELMKQCDIFIDQLMIGMHGLASAEAMTFGKPVLCYMAKEVLQNQFPEECPVVNVSIDTIEAKLEELILHPELRVSIGKQSRAYAEAFHDAHVKSKELLSYYQRLP